MRDEVGRVTQPVQIRKKKEAVILKHCAANISVLKGMEHLKNIYEYYRKRCPEKNRILLQSPKAEVSRQAAAAIINLVLNRYAQQEECTEDEWETDEAWYEGEEEKPWGGQDYLVVDAKKLVGDSDDDAISQMAMIMQMEGGKSQNLQQVFFDSAENVLVECRGKFDEEKLIEILEDKQCENIIVSMPDIIERRKLAERLMFEQGFEVLTVESPKEEYYENLLKRYLMERGYSLWETGGESELLEKLAKFRGEYFSESDVFIYADRAIEQKQQEGKVLFRENFTLPDIETGSSSQEMLEKMIGLKKVKRQIEKICAVRTIQERYAIKEQLGTHHNIAFAGAPGTGKSEVARLYSRILAERRVTNGKFISAKRGDIIGKYVGHTAPKIQKLFEQAEGGILFIDEAGSLTTEDDFTNEAVTELVRFMEEKPQTTVIFATYPEKLQELLDKDAGLASRISKVLYFPSYNEEELIQIFFYLAEKSGWGIEDGLPQILKQYIIQLKRAQGAKFGNAREMRKLLEAAIENGCHRICRETGGQALPERIILVSDVKEAMWEIMPKGKENRKIGFAIPGNECGK